MGSVGLRWPELHAGEEGTRGRQRWVALTTIAARRPRGEERPLSRINLACVTSSPHPRGAARGGAACVPIERPHAMQGMDISPPVNLEAEGREAPMTSIKAKGGGGRLPAVGEGEGGQAP
jgi:hypothetical protein